MKLSVFFGNAEIRFSPEFGFTHKKINAYAVAETFFNDFAEFGRNELADIFGCVPSQINYVIATRFNPQKGYSVESRRGGGGYIRISRIKDGKISDAESIGDECDPESAKKVITQLFNMRELDAKSAKMLLAALWAIDSDKVRAKALKNALMEL